MPDREKVIKGVRKCLSHKQCSENGCPYENECAVEHLNDPLLRDALSLLKEQGKSKQVIRKQCKRQRFDGAVEYYAEWRCPHCDSLLKQGYGAPWVKYCFYCGNPVTWEGR